MRPLPKAPSFRLDGKRALVTGASRGIGRAAAAALADAGAHVVLASRNTDELADLAAAIRATGGEASVLALDVAELAAARHAIEREPPVDVFVNNAGVARHAAFTDVSVEEFDAVMGVNVRGAFFAAQAVARRMIEGGLKGSIINMSSQMGHVGGPQRSVYCASKFAVEGMTKAMAIDLATHGIRVNSLCPTFIETPLTAPILGDAAFVAHVERMILAGRTGQVEDLTGAILFLASEASQLMTGSSLMIDGGWTAH
ncbi:MAG: SDR family oxidoreductase [Geminicoccaceae bacterium]|nr:MAG: SDR family oxidoreductase [Geminicoccaceae bacterium]